jgi:hypothetical protein
MHTFLLIAFFSLAPAAGRQNGTAQPNGRIPSAAAVEQAVWGYFQGRRDFRAGDLITRDQVAPLLKQLQTNGLPLSDADEILETLPAADSFLVQQFGTPAGRKFMRRISAYPNVFDRLERLAALPNGEQTIRDLIRNPGGEKMVAYMTTSPAGKNVGKVMTGGPQGKLFTVPTGRLYTVAMLLSRLEESRAAALKPVGKSRGRQ